MRALRCCRRAATGILIAAIALLATSSRAQIVQEGEGDAGAVRFGQAIATRYKVGAKIVAKGGAVQNILVMVAVPLECAEQEVHVIEEDFSPHVEGVEVRTLPTDARAEAGARQMLITVPELPARQEAYALITYEVLTKAILPPTETATLAAPAKPDRFIKPYLSASPFINVGHRKIRDAVRDALAAAEKDGAVEAESETEGGSAAAGESAASVPAADAVATFKTGDEATEEPAVDDEAPSDWKRAEALYDYVLEHVDYEEGAADKSALDTLEDGKADCHGIAALFVAMCRTAKIPARMVWVDGHQYAEFYLESEAGKGQWYPVQSAGTRAFGEMPLPKVILQKGDNFRVPERRRERLRYASDYTMLLSSPKHKPKVTYVREQL